VTLIQDKTRPESSVLLYRFIITLAVSTAKSVKQRSGVCPFICRFSPVFVSSVNAVMINEHCPDAASVRFGPLCSYRQITRVLRDLGGCMEFVVQHDERPLSVYNEHPKHSVR